MNVPDLLGQLGQAQQQLRARLMGFDDSACRMQHHPDLSPLGWHLGHCVFIENYWLREVVMEDARLTEPLHNLYIPENIPRPQRGAALPPRQALLTSARHQQTANRRLLTKWSEQKFRHPLLEQDYLILFLIQHHSQHLETMHLVCNQQALKQVNEHYLVRSRLGPKPLDGDNVWVPTGRYPIGGAQPQACDNELPAYWAETQGFAIARRPVSNAQYLGFIEDRGYRQDTFWSEEGRQWRQAHEVAGPDHWRQDREGAWFAIDRQGAHELVPDEPVSGLSYYEAAAFAHWAGARLPHEQEWEIASRLGELADTGRAWEWCANAFFPYAGFVPFPYRGYSLPWFDGQHVSLRGASRYSSPSIVRASFRNFYTKDKRHIAAGLRLAR